MKKHLVSAVVFVLSFAAGHGCSKMSRADRAEFMVETARGTCEFFDGDYPDGSPAEIDGICRGLTQSIPDAGAPECPSPVAEDASVLLPDAAP